MTIKGFIWLQDMLHLSMFQMVSWSTEIKHSWKQSLFELFRRELNEPSPPFLKATGGWNYNIDDRQAKGQRSSCVMAVIWQVTSDLTPSLWNYFSLRVVSTESRSGLMLCSRKTNKRLREKKGGWEWGYTTTTTNVHKNIVLRLCSRLRSFVWLGIRS